MSLKKELEIWASALQAYESENFSDCLDKFATIAESSKIFFNIGLVHATLGEHAIAVENFAAAIELDQYLAIAYFQSGVSNFLLGKYPEARRDFDDAFAYLRSNSTIDYEQLGLKFRLYSCEILFNRGLSSIYMGNQQQGLADFQEALKEKQTPEHNVIDDALADRVNGYTVFSIPVGILYRPAENKLKNLKTRNYLGSAKLVAATDKNDAFTTFSGVTRQKRGIENPLGGGGGSFSGPLDGLQRAGTLAARRNPEEDPGARPAEGGSMPLARRPTVNPGTLRRENTTGSASRPANGLPNTNLSRSMTTGGGGMGKGAATPGRDGERMPTGLLTPPTSGEDERMLDELEEINFDGLPNGPPGRDGRGGGNNNYSNQTDFIDDYYNDSPTQPLNPARGKDRNSPNSLPPLPQIPQLPPMPPMPDSANSRVADWARKNATGARPMTEASLYPSRMPSMQRKNTIGGGGGGGGGPGLGRSPTLRLPYDQQDAYDGMDSATVLSSQWEMSKVIVKLRWKGDTRGMTIPVDMPFESFVEKVRVKLGSPSDLPMKYKDAEGSLISIIDDGDWESAIDEAREVSKRGQGKLEIMVEG